MPLDEEENEPKKIESNKARLSATVPKEVMRGLSRLVPNTFGTISEAATFALTKMLTEYDRLEELETMKSEISELRERLDTMQRKLDTKEKR